MAIKILVGGPVRQDIPVLEAHIQTLKALIAPKGVELDFAFINDAPQEVFDETEELLGSLPSVAFASTRPNDAQYAISDDTHKWNESTFEHLAKAKQKLLSYAIEKGYTHTLLVDSDLLLEPTTLLSLHSLKLPIVSAVFWTRWHNNSPAPMPQVWLKHPYGLEGFGMDGNTFIRRLAHREVLHVLGGGACHLIDTNVLKDVYYHPRVQGLPTDGMWQGEDRSFAIRAERAHIKQYADAWPDIYHAYHLHQRTPEALDEALQLILAPRQSAASYGDLISFTVESLQNVADVKRMKPTNKAFRGRLGGIKMHPELEDALLDMHVGETRPIELRYAPWHELAQLAGKTHMVAVHLVDVKPFGYAPVLEEVIYGRR